MLGFCIMTRAENHIFDDNGPDKADGGGAVDSSGGPKELPQDVAQFIDQLAQEQKMLIVLQRELYDESWPAMLADLRNRLDGKPYIFKLANRIREDIARIEQLQSFEQEHGIKLADYVEPPAAPAGG